MKTYILSIALLCISTSAFAKEGVPERNPASERVLGECATKARAQLHRKTGRDEVTILNCKKEAGQTTCTGYASEDDGAGTVDFVFGIKSNCKFSFYRETVRE